MKIINKTYQNVREGESTIQKTPITNLPDATELPYGSLIHVVTKLGTGNYESRKMTTDDFKQKIYDSIQNTFKTSYWDTHEKSQTQHINDTEIPGINPQDIRPKGSSFYELMEFLRDKDDNKKNDDETTYAPMEVPEDDPDGFIDHLYFDFDLIKRYMVVKDGDIETDISNLKGGADELGCYFAPKMRFATTALDNNIEVVVTSDTLNHDLTENDTYCQMRIESGNKISSPWTCPESGNLVIYGWLDSSDCLNNKATPSAFCVIEGNINKNWEVISACPVTPAKNITYVGFNLTVKKGLVIRARTGFVCGAKSGQFSNQQDGYDTLSNSTANGFKCMIYMKEPNIDEEGTESDDNT